MPQPTPLQITTAAEQVDDPARFRTSHGVDGEITPRQIFLQRHIGTGMTDKTGVSRAHLALGTRQRPFVMRLGV